MGVEQIVTSYSRQESEHAFPQTLPGRTGLHIKMGNRSKSQMSLCRACRIKKKRPIVASKSANPAFSQSLVQKASVSVCQSLSQPVAKAVHRFSERGEVGCCFPGQCSGALTTAPFSLGIFYPWVPFLLEWNDFAAIHNDAILFSPMQKDVFELTLARHPPQTAKKLGNVRSGGEASENSPLPAQRTGGPLLLSR